jgi:hypothetical protein
LGARITIADDVVAAVVLIAVTPSSVEAFFTILNTPPVT